jgi:hypothetical protein
MPLSDPQLRMVVAVTGSDLPTFRHPQSPTFQHPHLPTFQYSQLRMVVAVTGRDLRVADLQDAGLRRSWLVLCRLAVASRDQELTIAVEAFGVIQLISFFSVLNSFMFLA